MGSCQNASFFCIWGGGCAASVRGRRGQGLVGINASRSTTFAFKTGVTFNVEVLFQDFVTGLSGALGRCRAICYVISNAHHVTPTYNVIPVPAYPTQPRSSRYSQITFSSSDFHTPCLTRAQKYSFVHFVRCVCLY